MNTFIRILPGLVLACSAVACDSGSSSTAPATTGAPTSAAPKSTTAAAAKPADTAKATTVAAKAPETEEIKNAKRKISFKAPKGTKTDPSGDSYTWDTMQIFVETPTAPLAKNEDLLKVVAGQGKDTAKIETANEGDILISTWKENPGPGAAVCGVKGKSVALRFMFEPDHKDIAMGICKSLKAD